MDTPSPEPGEARFDCAVCGGPAGRVKFLTSADAVSEDGAPSLQALAELDVMYRPMRQAALLVETFFGVATNPVSSERMEWVSYAIADRDAAALYRMGYAYAPFHCPECAACYCGEHWDWREFDDGPFSGVEGHCPDGHFHVLAY
ncbi:hypothetical protein H7J50_04425 [Mycobacterium intermedium]|uniref:hypothetical protein n=1 Tax=Mycobacterium intermedium TaxID=28445 RepID=UPI00111C6D57|nr:hypothetical protein [Mycobacterium intermedium]MCV6963055.1 hypothetical protein [Mycobacterium intermedium]